MINHVTEEVIDATFISLMSTEQYNALSGLGQLSVEYLRNKAEQAIYPEKITGITNEQ
jgi:hypothetical protein